MKDAQDCSSKLEGADFTCLSPRRLTIALACVDSAISFFSFIVILWTICPRLVAVPIGYATLGTLVMSLTVRRLIGSHFNQEKVEAEFRRLIYARENSTSIASYRGTGREGFFTSSLPQVVSASSRSDTSRDC